jgi:N-methylhydantoinase A/oxoprolinase/acetone carboxylase beta subunit
MGLRVGVDVGGTFTKAVAVCAGTGAVVARSVVPTTHEHDDGVSAGVVHVIAELATQVDPGSIELVTHSTTQAVNAMLEGDAAPVGVLGLGRAPDVRKARKRTAVRLSMPADFLIGSDGTVIAARYGKHADDQWSVDELLALGSQRTGAA